MEAEAKRNKLPTPPPLSPAERLLHGSIGAAAERLNELQEYYRQNPKARARDLAARGLQSELKAHEDFAAKQYAGLSREGQTRANPVMQALEDQRRQVEEEELQRRKKMNHELKDGSRGLESFAKTIAVGSYLHQSFNQLAATAHRIYEEGRRGVYAYHPGLQSTAHATEQLVEGAHAEAAGMTEAERERLRADQLRAQWLRHMEEERRRQQANQPPETNWDIFRRAMFGPLGYMFRGQQPDQAFGDVRRLYERLRGNHYEQNLRNAGIEPEKPKEDFRIPGVQPGITTGLGYQSELQVALLNRDDASNAILQQQLQHLAGIQGVLSEIKGNTNGLENQGWAGPQ